MRPALGIVPACIASFLLASASLISAVGPAQPPQGFSGDSNFDMVVPSFSDDDVARLSGNLDTALSLGGPDARGREDRKAALLDFGRRLQMGRLTAAQEAAVLHHLGDAAGIYPSDREAIELTQHVISALTIGKIAPDIVGRDLDGEMLRLGDHRDQVVAIVFSGDWCGICRSEYPYDRFLLDLYRDWPFALLVVNSDADPATAKRAYATRGLTFRSWFDGDGSGGPRGPIASAWNVAGWPVSYLLDRRGVIRFVNLRHEDLRKGVKQLMVDPARRP